MELKIRASTNLKKSTNLHLYISLRKRYTYKTGIFVVRIKKIVSVETLKKQENDFITRVVLANLVFVFRIQSRD